jgi:outer membrane beta-barrel protein
MKTKFIGLLVFGFLFFSLSANAENDLGEQLEALKLPSNVAPAGVTSEKLYSVQNRFTRLDRRFEFNLGGAKNFTGNGLLSMHQLNAGVIYHLNDRWSVSASGSYGFNDFTDSAYRLMQNEGIVPDAAIVKWRSDLLANYNLFYGKFRMNMDQVFYFDQYVAVGPGLVNTQYGTAPAAVLDIGFAVWFGKNWSARFGAKNDIYREKTMTGNDLVDHMLGHLEVGYLIGSGEQSYE